jgi:hypothetical protein
VGKFVSINRPIELVICSLSVKGITKVVTCDLTPQQYFGTQSSVAAEIEAVIGFDSRA